MTNNINCKRVLFGGLAAGLFINLVEMLTHGFYLESRYAPLSKMGFYHDHEHAALPFMPAFNLICFGAGIALAWLYASSRDTLGPGVKTTLKIGVVTAFLIAGATQYAAATWQATGKFIPLVTSIAILIECTIGTLIAGAIYKPKA